MLSTTEVDGYPDIFPKVCKGYTGNLCNKINRFNKWYLHDIFNIHKKKKLWTKSQLSELKAHQSIF